MNVVFTKDEADLVRTALLEHKQRLEQSAQYVDRDTVAGRHYDDDICLTYSAMHALSTARRDPGAAPDVTVPQQGGSSEMLRASVPS